MADRQISATRTISAPAARLFDLVADPAKHPLVDGSGTVRGVRENQTKRLELGSRFGMEMRMGVPYKITNQVVEFEEGSLIAWRHPGKHIWRWEFKAIDDDRTEVTETFDWSGVKAAKFYEIAGLPRRNLKSMQNSLLRMEQVAVG
ncbi:SRPBCC family protein [Actinoalloteichus hymeniacidonis]|uniref:Polyketide cyclase / dehydrase and lipid transport n=1 Tax=Actinoalloteichus hymeniacidonis TaxID=340345 RepID=A0AAC9HQ41_9PSEU|nr:SRPBCC family protein [Actinoalloteichus hymeniacidonis]AOS63279.1 Polyketide cyclase / dehydrase and lipid transport [Actinoalloteichus hymeniacidonis]MBB5908682.1 uncharacterized protein YndB with AHSA1/START domain [Actinoalloteichus hymeniacidonis]